MKNPFLKTNVALAALTLCTASFVSAADEKKPAGPDRAEIMKQFDANGDGQLDQTEREAVRKHMESMRGDAGGRGGQGAQGQRGGQGGRGGQGQRGGNPMAEFDANGDGKLDDSERAAASAAMRERTQGDERAMKRFDTDGDGKLSDAEWGKASKAMQDRMGQGGRGGRGNGGEGRRQRGE